MFLAIERKVKKKMKIKHNMHTHTHTHNVAKEMENLSKYTNQSINQLIIGVHIKIEKNVQREREREKKKLFA